ncbi:hypothetical protein ANO11243_072240 [Dothideomycetidae sp. 11243]|nr:hypothetical protein ANO11243_072240 [fungal sp. No.11243]
MSVSSSGPRASARPVQRAAAHHPVDTSPPPADAAVGDGMVESPSISSPNALARFEYEAGHTRDCTKVLMVEWEDDDTTRDIQGDWEVSWEHKRAVLSARETPHTGINRLYFLLSAGERVPGVVRLTLNPTGGDAASTAPVMWKANPLPAIFPPELGASAREAGKKGVLHTIWAKRRLQVLANEIEHGSADNEDGEALAMALREKEWIEDHFGVQMRPAAAHSNHRDMLRQVSGGASNASPSSPRSPESGRLMEKLKGLKLQTSDPRTAEEHSGHDTEPDFSVTFNPLSPEQSDVAVSSFGSFAALKGLPDPRTLAAKPPQRSEQPTVRRITPPRTTSDGRAQTRSGGFHSMDALAKGHETGFVHDSHEDDREDDLFALPISPRSPDMGRSPFSFGAADTRPYVGAG